MPPRETSSGREGDEERRMPDWSGGAGDREVVVGLEPEGQVERRSMRSMEVL